MWKIVIGIVIAGITIMIILSQRGSHNWKSGKYAPIEDEDTEEQSFEEPVKTLEDESGSVSQRMPEYHKFPGPLFMGC